MTEKTKLNCSVNHNYREGYQQGRADAIDEFDRICEEARSHNFGVCDANFVIDVIKAKVKEQLKEQKQ